MAVVRDAVFEDLEAVKRILQTNGQIGDITGKDMQDFVLAEIDGDVVGCGMLKEHENSVEVSKVSVLPGHQGKGIGKAIALTLLSRVKTRKCWLLSVDSHSYWEQFEFHILPENEEPKEAKKYCEKCEQRQECNRVVMVRKGR